MQYFRRIVEDEIHQFVTEYIEDTRTNETLTTDDNKNLTTNFKSKGDWNVCAIALKPMCICIKIKISMKWYSMLVRWMFTLYCDTIRTIVSWSLGFTFAHDHSVEWNSYTIFFLLFFHFPILYYTIQWQAYRIIPFFWCLSANIVHPVKKNEEK